MSSYCPYKAAEVPIFWPCELGPHAKPKNPRKENIREGEREREEEEKKEASNFGLNIVYALTKISACTPLRQIFKQYVSHYITLFTMFLLSHKYK